MISRCSSSARRAISGASTAISAATISPRPRTETTFGSSRRPSCSRSPLLAHGGQERLVVDHVERGVRGDRDDRAARERRAVVAGREHVLQPRSDHERTDRQAAAEPLRQRHRVRHDADLLVGPQRAGAAHPALDLVEDERGAGGVAGLADRRAARRSPSGSRPTRPGPARSARRRSCRRRRPGSLRPPDRAEARHERRERRLLGLLRRRATARRTCGRGTRRGRRRRRRAGAPCARA